MNSFTDLPAWEKSTLLNTEAGLTHTRFSLSSSFTFRPGILAGTASCQLLFLLLAYLLHNFCYQNPISMLVFQTVIMKQCGKILSGSCISSNVNFRPRN